MFNKLKSALSRKGNEAPVNLEIESITVKLTGMHCSSCAVNIDLALEDLPGIKSVKTHYPSSTSVIKYDATQITIPSINEALVKLGYLAKANK